MNQVTRFPLRHFKRIGLGLIAVEEARKQILSRPDLWNAHSARTDESSPHYGVSDQWLRFRAPEELIEPRNYIEPHWPVWYPSWRALTHIQPIVFGLMCMCAATHLGGVLLTKIPPYGRVKPHRDFGWHAESMDTKVHVAIQSNQGCVNYCEDEAISMKTGEMWTFSNLKDHSVENNGETDRITLIVCCRTT